MWWPWLDQRSGHCKCGWVCRCLGPEWPLLTGSAKRALRVSLLEFLDVQAWLNTHDDGLAPGSRNPAIACFPGTPCPLTILNSPSRLLTQTPWGTYCPQSSRDQMYGYNRRDGRNILVLKLMLLLLKHCRRIVDEDAMETKFSLSWLRYCLYLFIILDQSNGITSAITLNETKSMID